MKSKKKNVNVKWLENLCLISHRWCENVDDGCLRKIKKKYMDTWIENKKMIEKCNLNFFVYMCGEKNSNAPEYSYTHSGKI